MTFRRLPLASLAIILALAGTVFGDETERVQKTIPLAPGGTLKLDNFSGRVTITGTDRSEVVIDAVRRAPKDRLDRIKLDIQSSGNTVTIEANKNTGSSFHGNNVVETEFDIQVPRHTNLDVHVFSSPVKVSDVTGNHRLHGFSSELRLAGISGPVKAETFSGRIALQMAGSSERPDLDLHTFSGDVDVALSATAHADVNFDTFSGDLTSDLPLTMTTKGRRSVKGQLNAAGSEAGARSYITIKTFSGDARIRK